MVEMSAKQTTEETALAIPQYAREDYKAIGSFDDAVALAVAAYGEVETASEELGDGFAILDKDDKGQLVKVPCMFLDWNFSLGDFGEFVSAHVISKTGAKFIVNDGSTGIYQQLRDYTNEHAGRQGGLFAPRGLRRSDYTYDDDGKQTPATTFYIDTAAS
jgi:hypothetical protein